MTEDKNIIGCFASISAGEMSDPQEKKDYLVEQGRIFRSYIWGESGFISQIKTLKWDVYGVDLKLILFQFFINPLPQQQEKIPKIENYRKREKSIAVPIIINHDNFFSKNEKERLDFIKFEMIKKLDLVAEVIREKKLDTQVEKLKVDLNRLLLPNDFIVTE